jgi:predicted alpha/beta-hydrolase family hydrolase
MREAAMLRFFSKLAAMIVFAGAAMAQTTPQAVGVVVMHGKGGLPTKTVAELAAGLEGKGHLVANIEMPWSANRNYDVNVAGAEAEVNTALARLRSKGAKHLFVAGHSQGGAFALYFGGKYPLDGIIAIAPGGAIAP